MSGAESSILYSFHTNGRSKTHYGFPFVILPKHFYMDLMSYVLFFSLHTILYNLKAKTSFWSVPYLHDNSGDEALYSSFLLLMVLEMFVGGVCLCPKVFIPHI